MYLYPVKLYWLSIIRGLESVMKTDPHRREVHQSCMYVCIYLSIYLSTYLFIYIYIYIDIYIYIYIYISLLSDITALCLKYILAICLSKVFHVEDYVLTQEDSSAPKV